MVAPAAAAAVLLSLATAPSSTAPPPPPARVFTNTDDVAALAADATTLWAATGGGLEAYDLGTLVRRRVYTTADGLAANALVGVAVDAGAIVARTAKARCQLAGDRFVCAPATPTSANAPSAPALFQGARVTARLSVGGRAFVGTAGRGLWLDGARPRALTPADQICGNHVVALARFRGAIWLGTFDRGLCAFDGRSFHWARAPFRMVNALAVADGALYVASTRGLFRSRDGRRFARFASLDGRGATDLAVDGQTLWTVTPAALWRVPLGARGRLRGYALPGGSHAVQAVDVAGGAVWMASEDRGAIRFRDGRFQVFDRAAGLPTSWAVDVAATADGGAYLATLRHGLLRLGADGRAAAVPGLPDRWLLHLARAGGRLWIGTQGGVAHLDGDRATSVAVTVAENALPHPCVHAVAVFDGATWLATEGGTAVFVER